VRTRINDVLYCAQFSPAGRNVVVHTDRLTKFDGDPPPEWRNAVEKLRTEAVEKQPVVAWTCPDERRESVNAAEAYCIPSIRFRKVCVSEKFNMKTVRSVNRMRHSEEQKKCRREFERVTWPCSYCECALYTSIAGFRDHMILIHKKNCSWTGVISNFVDETTAEGAGERIRSQRAKKRRRKSLTLRNIL